MSVVTVVWSVVAGGVFLGAGLVVAVTVKRLFFPAWGSSLAVTAVALIWLGWALGLGQLLGAFGLLRQGALLVTAVASAAAVVPAARRVRRRAAALPGAPVASDTKAEPVEPDTTTGAPATSRWEHKALVVATVLLVLFVGAIWTAKTVIALHRGINDPDSLGYHVPFAVIFAHSGYADQGRYLDPLVPIQFFPANDELLSAIGLALTHSLAVAALKNLVMGGLIIVAAHALGKAFGAAWPAVAAAAVVLGCPVIAFSQPGSATNDTMLLLAVLGGLAVLAYARDGPAPYVLVLACAGIALGVKFSGIVPAAALAALAVILLLARVARHRWRWVGAGLVASAVMGGSWYARNAVNYGNPVPPVKVGIGPFHLHTVNGYAAALAFSVAHYAVRGQYLGLFAQGLIKGFGPFIVATFLLGLVGAVAGLRSHDGFRRGLVVFWVVALAGYVVTPASAFGDGRTQITVGFVINLHYAAPALLVAAVAGAIAVGGWRWNWIVPLLGVAAVATSISRGRAIAVWSPELGGRGFELLLVAAGLAGAATLAWLIPSRRRLMLPAAVVTTVVAVVGVAIVAGLYPSRRASDPLVAWSNAIRGARIAGWIGNVADLYGYQEHNQVVILSRLENGAAVPVATCQAWKQALVDGHFNFTAVIRGTPWQRWLKADPAFVLAVDQTRDAPRGDLLTARRGAAVVYQLVGTPDLTCQGQTSADADYWDTPPKTR